jgi:hypothetical protein
MSSAPLKRPEPVYVESSRIAVPSFILLGIAIVCFIGVAILGVQNPKQFGFSWLLAFTYCFTIICGALFWILVHHAVDANWTVVVRRILENLACLAPWLTLAFIPLLFVLPEVFKWWNMPPGKDVLLDGKAEYLNHGMFYGKAAAYFVILTALAYILRSISISQDKDGDPHKSILSRQVAYPGIMLFVLVITFAAIDWLMGLDFHWFSTMWGVYIFAGAAQSSMALLIVISNLLWRAGYLKGVMSVEHNHIMGKLLFAFTVFWAYIAFSQYMLQYYANIPEETIFFENRNTGTWQNLSVVLVFGHFFIPFFLLITQPSKRDPRRLCFAALWLLVFQAVDLFWIIMPQMQVNAKNITGFAVHPLDFLSLIGLVAFFAFLFLRSLPKSSVFPARDPRLYESVTLIN